MFKALVDAGGERGNRKSESEMSQPGAATPSLQGMTCVNKCQGVENEKRRKGSSNEVPGEFRRRRNDPVDLKQNPRAECLKSHTRKPLQPRFLIARL